MVPFGSASAASTGVVLTPSLTRIGDQVALDVFYERGANRFTTGPSVVLTPSLLPQPTIWGWQLGWQYHFVTESRFRPYVHPEYQVVFFRPGTMHTLRWQYGL